MRRSEGSRDAPGACAVAAAHAQNLFANLFVTGGVKVRVWGRGRAAACPGASAHPMPCRCTASPWRCLGPKGAACAWPPERLQCHANLTY